METPPELPPPKAPLGWQFYVTLLAPLAVVALGLCFANSLTSLAGPLLGLGGVGIIVASVVLAAQLSRRMGQPGKSTLGLGVLLFFALLAFYGVCFFVGCTAAVMVS